MDIDRTEVREALLRADGPSEAGRCGWIALGLIILLIPGIAPAGFFFGIVSAEAVADAFGQALDQGIAGRLAVIAAAIIALLLSAVIILFLTRIIDRVVRGMTRRSPAAVGKHPV